MPGRKKHSRQRDKYFHEDTWICYFCWKSLNITMNDEILKIVINIRHDSQYLQWPVNCEPSNTFGTLELLFPISKKDWSCFLPISKKDRSSYVPKSIVLVSSNFQKGLILLRSKKHYSCFIPIFKMDRSSYVPQSIVLVSSQKGWFVLGHCGRNTSGKYISLFIILI